MSIINLLVTEEYAEQIAAVFDTELDGAHLQALRNLASEWWPEWDAIIQAEAQRAQLAQQAADTLQQLEGRLPDGEDKAAVAALRARLAGR